ncbi:MAG: DUF1080 domain-containing protein [Leeuwenhoekiella sp.]
MIKRSLILSSLVILCISCDENLRNSGNSTETEAVTDTIAADSTEAEITDPEATEFWDPEPAVVSFDKNNIPSDAIVLFAGDNLDAWKSVTDTTQAAGWTVNNDKTFSVKPKGGDIETKEKFGDIQLHIEWRAPQEVVGESQGRGNSGIFLQKKYEVQVLDSYENRTYSNGQASSLYKQHPPLVNATKPTSEWQTYDIIFHQPEFDKDGNKTKAGRLTVMHNGVLTQDNVEIMGTTEYIGHPKTIPHGPDSIELQDHGNPVSYRNIWVRKL